MSVLAVVDSNKVEFRAMDVTFLFYQLKILRYKSFVCKRERALIQNTDRMTVRSTDLQTG